MPNLEVTPGWLDVREIGIELARGGPNGNMNEQAKALAARTEYLKENGLNNSFFEIKPSGMEDRGSALISYLNSLPRYSSVKIPSGKYYFDGSLGTRTLNNALNIDAEGVTFLMSPTPTGAPVLEIKNPEPVVSYSANLVLNSLLKSDNKLNVKSETLLDNPNDYFVVLISTEVMNPRVGYPAPYYKNITLDIAQSDYTLRDKLPFNFVDLTKVTVFFVKKNKQNSIKGLKIKPTVQNVNYNTWLQLSYLNNSTISNLDVDFSEYPSFGIALLIQRCMGVDFLKSGNKGAERDGNDSYAFMNSCSSYLNFDKCYSVGQKGTIKKNRGYVARHGFMITFDKCLLGGIDDHWGYDYFIKDCNLGTGITLAGGSLTVENTRASDRLVNLREDTPYCDGTLKIRKSYGSTCILRAYGHTFEQANTGIYGQYKVWDIIDIDVDCSSDMFTSAPIIIKEPRANQSDVYRDTILKITGCYKMIDASKPLFQGWYQQNTDGIEETDFYTDLESKRLFSVVDINVKVFVSDGANTSRASLIESIVAKSITLSSNHATFIDIRAVDEFNILNSKIKDNKAAPLSYLSSELNISNVDLTGSPNFWNRGAAHKVFITSGKIENQNRLVSAFRDNLESCSGVSFADESWKSAGNLSLRNYRKGLTVIYTTTAVISLSDGASSSQLTASSAAFNINHLIVGTIAYNGVVVDVYRDTTTEYNIRFKLRNVSGASLSIPSGTKVILKAVG